jgi:hypothetical protein
MMAWLIAFHADGAPDPHYVCFYITLKYRLPDGSTLGIEQQAAWCKECQSFGTAEFVPSVEELRQRIEELETPTQVRPSSFTTAFSTKHRETASLSPLSALK